MTDAPVLESEGNHPLIAFDSYLLLWCSFTTKNYHWKVVCVIQIDKYLVQLPGGTESLMEPCKVIVFQALSGCPKYIYLLWSFLNQFTVLNGKYLVDRLYTGNVCFILWTVCCHCFMTSLGFIMTAHCNTQENTCTVLICLQDLNNIKITSLS